MNSFAQLVDDLGGPAAVARKLNKPFTTVNSWRDRDNIPPDYWPEIKQLARAKRIAGVTDANLIGLKAPRLKEAV